MIEWLLSHLWVPVILLTVLVVLALRKRPSEEADAGERSRSEELGLPKPESVQAGMVVTRMEVSGHVRVRDASGDRTVALPSSPFGAGELPEAIWGVAGGPIFAVGKLYSGQPGADHGAVYRKDPGGDWELVHVLRDRTLHRVCGTRADDVLAGAIGGILHFDGERFAFTELPYSMMIKTWREDDGLIAQAFDGSCSFLVRDGVPEPTHRREEPDDDRRTFVDGEVAYTVFDRAVEVGPDVLDAAEAAEIRDELAQVASVLDRS